MFPSHRPPTTRASYLRGGAVSPCSWNFSSENLAMVMSTSPRRSVVNQAPLRRTRASISSLGLEVITYTEVCVSLRPYFWARFVAELCANQPPPVRKLCNHFR